MPAAWSQYDVYEVDKCLISMNAEDELGSSSVVWWYGTLAMSTFFHHPDTTVTDRS